MEVDECLAMLEEEAHKENPEEEYQMYAAYRLGLIREEIDKLESMIADLISKTRQQNCDGQDRGKTKD